jgi:hypothetical protein
MTINNNFDTILHCFFRENMYNNTYFVTVSAISLPYYLNRQLSVLSTFYLLTSSSFLLTFTEQNCNSESADEISIHFTEPSCYCCNLCQDRMEMSLHTCTSKSKPFWTRNAVNIRHNCSCAVKHWSMSAWSCSRKNLESSKSASSIDKCFTMADLSGMARRATCQNQTKSTL